MTDLANAAAAVAAGYTKTQIDRGATPPGGALRYTTVFEKWVSGATGQSGAMIRATGESNVDAATADTNALASLNGTRKHRYGAGATANKDSQGNSHTFDAT
jgi:hypothetical protein